MRAPIPPGRAQALAVLAAVGSLGAFGSPAVGFSSAAALQAPQDESRPAWLGIRLNQRYECVWETTENWKSCDLVLHVVGVQDGGPAQSAGIEPGDRMIALDGKDLTFATWDRLRSSIRPGRPVSIDVMRGDARHFVRVTPAVRTPGSDAGRWIAPRFAAARTPSVFVVRLTEVDENEGGFALAIRDTGDQTVSVEPAALRVSDGQLRLAPLNEELFVELPSLRREIVGSLRGISDSSYEQATSAVQAMANIRARLSSDEEFRTQLTRIAQVGLDEVRLATGFRRSFGGAEFEEARRRLASAVDARRAGLLVLRVVSGTPAERLGLVPGDLVFDAGGKEVRTVGDLSRAVEAADGAIEVRWERRGTTMSGRFPR